MEKQPGLQPALQAKAIAAAKLVLQDLDPVAKRRRQLFGSGPPQGILAFHVKTLRNFSKTFFFTSTFAGCNEIRLFLKMSVQNLSKCSKVVTVKKDAAAPKSKLVMGQQSKLWSRKSLSPADARQRGSSFGGHRDSLAGGKAEITIDELKTFTLDISNKRSHANNTITLELVEAGGAKASSNIGFATLHLYDLIKEMYGMKTTPLMIKDKRIADLEYEYVFRYGTFGYGYSHELQQNDLPITQIMNESMFFRLAPTQDRTDDDGLLTPTQVPPPKSLYDGNEDEESLANRNRAVTSEIEMFTSVDTSNVDSLIKNRKRLDRLKEEYSSLKTRHDRNKYLENLLARTGAPVGEGQDDDADGRRDSDEGARSRAASSVQIDSQRQTEAVKAVIGNLSPLLLMAPGLQTRSDSRASKGTLHPRDSTATDSGPDPIERLRKLYEDQVGRSESEESGPESPRPGTPDQPEKKGFMGILRRKVLTPMRFNKMMKGTKDSLNLSDAEEGQSSGPQTSDDESSPRKTHMSDLVRRMGKGAPPESEKSPAKKPYLLSWKRAVAAAPTTSSPPAAIVMESEDSQREPATHSDEDTT